MLFTEVNPDKGTETTVKIKPYQINLEFTEVNPDKGTETVESGLIIFHDESLQKLTPIRGRKRVCIPRFKSSEG